MACVERSNATQTAHDVSVIICTYAEERWDDLIAALESVRQQTLLPREIIVVIDHNPNLLKRVQEYIPWVVAVESIGARGLSGARNSGIAMAQGTIIAFLDDDATASPDWLRLLVEGLTDPDTLGVGGAVVPLWPTGIPLWLPEEFYWVVGCTYRGMPQSISIIRNPIGANMAFRRTIFDIAGGFRSEVGRIGKRPFGCEETELCIRAKQLCPQNNFLYQPRASVVHRIPSNRISWRYFCSRCYSEGLSKAVVTDYVGLKAGLATEYAYVLRALSQGILSGLSRALFHRDPYGLTKAGAIFIGLALTTGGYLLGSSLSKVVRSRNVNSAEAVAHRSSETPLYFKRQS